MEEYTMKDKKYYEDLLEAVNNGVVELRNKPEELKCGFQISHGGILNAYREGDVGFEDAIKHLEGLGAKSGSRTGSTGDRVAEQGGQQDGGVYEAIEPLINDMMKYNRKPRDRACKLLMALNISPDAVKIFLKNKWVG